MNRQTGAPLGRLLGNNKSDGWGVMRLQPSASRVAPNKDWGFQNPVVGGLSIPKAFECGWNMMSSGKWIGLKTKRTIKFGATVLYTHQKPF